jgi:peptidyl-prolyl cis-trans isomerase C
MVRVVLFLALPGMAWLLPGHAMAGSATADEVVRQERPVAARVNGEPIYEDQLRSIIEQGMRPFRKRGMLEAPEDLVANLRSQALEEMIAETLIAQQSLKLSLENLDLKLARRIKELEEKLPPEERLPAYLSRRGLAMAELQESLEAQIRREEYLEHAGILHPTIPESRIYEMYEGIEESYAGQESVNISHILIKRNRSPDMDTHRLRREEAEAIRREILAGGNFEELAREHSGCGSASEGGSLGYIRKTYMPAEFERVAFALEEGSISDVVETEFGFHIIKAFDRKPLGAAPYQEVRNFLRRYLENEESQRQLASHVAALREKAVIEIARD